MNEYRVVCDNPEHVTYPEYMTLAEAREYLDQWQNDCPSVRVQRIVWEDVPMPEPLPDDLPEEVWLTLNRDSGVRNIATGVAKITDAHRERWRYFTARIPRDAWTEVQ